jgi:hypothetical protein
VAIDADFQGWECVHLVGGHGVSETFSLPLDEQESEPLRRSALVVRGALDELLQKA